MTRPLNKILICQASLLSCMLLGSCKSQNSREKHALGEVTWSNDASQWADVSREYVIKEIQSNSRDAIKFLATDHVIHKSVNQMIEQIDSSARKKYPDLLANAPKPQALVVGDENATALALSSSVCIDLPFEKEGQREEGGPLRIDPLGNVLNENGGFVCPEKMKRADEVKNILDLYNAAASQNCQIALSGNKLVMKSSCANHDVVNSKKIVFQTSSPFIQINTGLIHLLNKNELESVIAHELSHYYRAHSLWGDSNRYGFFYQRAHHTPSARPLPDKSGESQYQAFTLQNYANTRLIRSQFSSEVFPGLVAIFLQDKNMRSRFEKGENCGEFVRKNEERQATEIVEIIFSGGKLKSENLALFTIFSNRMNQCLKMNSPYSPNWKLGLSEAIALVFDSRISPFEPNDYTTLMDKLPKSYEERLAKRAEIFEIARRNGLGWYTAEQEADELSLELLHLSGQDPASAYGALFKLMGRKDEMDLNGLTNVECRKLLAENWQMDSKLVNMFYGDLNDPHHSLCYRVWNVYQEISDHGYKGPYTKSNSQIPSFQLLNQSQLPSGGFANPMFKKSSKNQLACVFSDSPRLGIGRN